MRYRADLQWVRMAFRNFSRTVVIAGIVQDKAYFRELIEPHLNDHDALYIGPVDVRGKNELFARARVLLHLNTIPERFGLVLVEANAAGVPVIAMDLGSCREVIKDGQTGFLVDNVTEAVRALGRISEIDRRACRSRVRQYFSIDTMVEGYERVYSTIFDLESKRRPLSRTLSDDTSTTPSSPSPRSPTQWKPFTTRRL